MEGLKTNCILYNCIESVFIQLYNIQFDFKVHNINPLLNSAKFARLLTNKNSLTDEVLSENQNVKLY